MTSIHRNLGSPATSDESHFANTPSQHGFVMAGMHTLFLCHMTCFHEKDHMYQVILQVHLPDYAMEQYVSDREEHPGEVYMLCNGKHFLMTLPQIHNGQLISWIGDIYRGMPALPITVPPLIGNVRVNIERVVLFRHIDFNMEYPKSLTYIVFGSGSEAHMSHYLTKAPDFDQVLDLTEVPPWLPPGQLEGGANINIPSLPHRPPYTSNPLTAPTYEVQFQGLEPISTIEIGPSYWFDDLKKGP